MDRIDFQKGKRKILKVIFGRTVLLFLSLIIQFAVLIFFFVKLSEYLGYYYGVGIIISVILLIYIVNSDENPSYKLAWGIPVALMPVFGSLFYLFVHIQPYRRIINNRLEEINYHTAGYMKQDPMVLQELEEKDIQVKHFADYMNLVGPFPVCKNSDAKFYPLGDDWYPDMLKRLKEAKEFIFIEFFIVNYGELWDSVLEILKQKAKEGVEVRFMYDGTCTFFRLPHNYPEYLGKMGIQCRVFSPIRPALSTYQNNRDHRKIVVIDGKVAYTGGVNLADEYINRIERFGHWKDTAVELTGEVVNSFTMLFLQNWNITSKPTEDVSKYIRSYKVESDGYIMGYTDSPFDHVEVGEAVYMDILNTAKHYVHIMTPYLILDNEMITSLAYAANRGIDVKIIMPHITDKPYAYIVARNYYEILLKKGIRIYEYEPGFIHAKEFISDDCKAVVGSVNMDYRSLYLNFECAAYLYQVNAVHDAEKDFQYTLRQFMEITLEDCRKYSGFKKFIGKFMWLFSPLM